MDASTSAAGAMTDDAIAEAEQHYEDGLEYLEADDFVPASDCFAKCLEAKVIKHGEHDPALAPVYLKYAISLLGCARLQGDRLLGALKTDAAKDGAASSSKAAATEDDDNSDLALAWQMGELARLVSSARKDALGDDAEAQLAEVHEVLGDIGAEREAFEGAISDFEQLAEMYGVLGDIGVKCEAYDQQLGHERSLASPAAGHLKMQALKHMDACKEVDVRWQAEVHFKMSIPLELLDRIDDALAHVNTAIAQLKFLLKQKHAAQAELEAAQKAGPPGAVAQEATAAAAAPDAAAVAPEDGAVALTAAAVPADAAASTVPVDGALEAGKAVAAAADGGTAGAADASAAAARNGDKGDDEDGAEAAEEEETDLEAVVRDVGELQAVLKELELRRQELATAKEQDKEVKAQLKAVFGGAMTDAMTSGFQGTAGASSSGAGAGADAGVIDLGVRSSKKGPKATGQAAADVKNVAVQDNASAPKRKAPDAPACQDTTDDKQSSAKKQAHK